MEILKKQTVHVTLKIKALIHTHTVRVKQFLLTTLIPSTSDSSIVEVIETCTNIPIAPRYLTGAISEIYSGATTVLIPIQWGT